MFPLVVQRSHPRRYSRARLHRRSGAARRVRRMRARALNGAAGRVIASGVARTRRLPELLKRDRSVAYLFVAPAVLLLACLLAYPFVRSIWYRLSDARVRETGAFIGDQNIRRIGANGISRQRL